MDDERGTELDAEIERLTVALDSLLAAIEIGLVLVEVDRDGGKRFVGAARRAWELLHDPQTLCAEET